MHGNIENIMENKTMQTENKMDARTGRYAGVMSTWKLPRKQN